MAIKKALNLIHAALCFSLIFWLGACTQKEPTIAHQQQDTREGSMNLSKNSLTTPATIPAIDTAAPDQYETATFGLG